LEWEVSNKAKISHDFAVSKNVGTPKQKFVIPQIKSQMLLAKQNFFLLHFRESPLMIAMLKYVVQSLNSFSKQTRLFYF